MSGKHHQLSLAAHLSKLGCRRSIDDEDDTFEDKFGAYALVSSGKQNWSCVNCLFFPLYSSQIFTINLYSPERRSWSLLQLLSF